jgi:hypothetical protein
MFYHKLLLFKTKYLNVTWRYLDQLRAASNDVFQHVISKCWKSIISYAQLPANQSATHDLRNSNH